MDPQIVPELDSSCDFMVNCVVMVLAQAAAVAKLQLPEWMERLATIFGTLTTVYGFLLRQHIQAGTSTPAPPPAPLRAGTASPHPGISVRRVGCGAAPC